MALIYATLVDCSNSTRKVSTTTVAVFDLFTEESLEKVDSRLLWTDRICKYRLLESKSHGFLKMRL